MQASSPTVELGGEIHLRVEALTSAPAEPGGEIHNVSIEMVSFVVQEMTLSF